MNGPNEKAKPGIHVLAKPIGSICDIACDYCFYLEKRELFPGERQFRMSDEVLAKYVEQYVEAQPTPVVEFVWHGGEPTLLGVDFYRRVVEAQKPFRGRKEIRNTLQTNALSIDDEWCAFFKEHDFFIGVSLDGPKEVHDRYRKDRHGRGTFDRVMVGVRLLQKHGVEFNALACVGRETAYKPLEVYRFFKEAGIRYIQFTPIIEREPDAETKAIKLWLARPAVLDRPEPNTKVTPWTVEPEAYGDFLIAICEEWVRKDVGTTFVMNFEWALNAWIGAGSPICIFSKTCGRAVAIEHDGSVYACDHYVYPEYKLGNVLAGNLGEMVEARWPTASVRTRRSRCPSTAASARSRRRAGAGAPSTASRPRPTASRDCTTSAPAIRNSSATFASTCGRWGRSSRTTCPSRPSCRRSTGR